MVIALGIGTLLIIAVYFGLSLKVGKTYEVIIADFKDKYQLMFMAPVSLYLIDNFKINGASI